MKFYSEVLEKLFDSETDLFEAENAHEKAEAEKALAAEKEKQERAEKEAHLAELKEKVITLKNEYLKAVENYHTAHRELHPVKKMGTFEGMFNDLIDSLFI